MRTALHGLALFGADLERTVGSLRGLPAFFRDYREFRRQYRASGREFPFGKFYPCLIDRHLGAGSAAGQYFHQDLLVAQWIFENRPERHLDLASRVDGFVAHVASFMPVEVLDIRPLVTTARNIAFRRLDASGDIGSLAGSAESLSCLHALEHFGLGRYSDTVDYYGYMKGWENLHAILRPGGVLYFSVPVGPQRVEFNGHRVFAPKTILEMARDRYRLERFAWVDPRGDLNLGIDPLSERPAKEDGCGIFQLRKIG